MRGILSPVPDHESPDGRFSDQPRVPRRTRAATIAAVALLHLVVVFALIKGLAAAGVIDDPFVDTSAYNVALPPPAAPPSPSDTGDSASGKAAPESAAAKPREAAAPKPRIPRKSDRAPPAASTGSQDRSGAGTSGAGSGGGGAGSGTGSGGSGTGSGGGAARPVEKTAGTIDSIRDYPRAGRDARLGHTAVIEMTVGTDGRARNCRVVTSSGDAESDRITCRLAEQRFRFRPRLDGNGQPVEAIYRWGQRFFVP